MRAGSWQKGLSMDADERRKLHLEITTLKAERILKWVNFVLGISAAVILWITLVNQIADTKATNQRMLQQWQYDAASGSTRRS